MNENRTLNNIENDDPNLNIDESNYINLINRLKEMRQTVVLLEKIIFKEI